MSEHDTDVMATKARIRAHMKSLRTAMPPEASARAAAEVAQQVLSSGLIEDDDVVAGYWSVPGELDITPLMKGLRDLGLKLALPEVAAFAAPMVFREYIDDLSLVESRHGIMQPPQDAAEVTPTVVILPLLAFHADGHRLGFGGGYYDRTLEAMHDAGHEPLTLGVAYDEQEVPDLPADDHDWPMDWIATPTRLIEGAS